jgi:hypothetical protein
MISMGVIKKKTSSDSVVAEPVSLYIQMVRPKLVIAAQQRDDLTKPNDPKAAQAGMQRRL